MARIAWVVLTMGNRPEELGVAIDSLRRQVIPAQIIVFANGVAASVVEASLSLVARSSVMVVGSETNLGAPGGRVAALEHVAPETEIIAFLDDDARVLADTLNGRVCVEFAESDVAVVAMRLVDAAGNSARRHVPRMGSKSADRRGDVAFFLAGAVAMRRSCYERAGGYWAPLVYAHEEIDLAWRIIDAGGRIVYRPELLVYHPRTPISRHEDGWSRTGRNRVAVARRNLPSPFLQIHTVVWLILGAIRAPSACRRPYVRGWLEGWRLSVDRRPIRYATVWRLCRLGRPPVI